MYAGNKESNKGNRCSMKVKLLILLALAGISAHVRAGNSQANDIVRDATGNFLTAGLANNATNRTTDYALARYLPNGSLDTTFNPMGMVPGTLQIDIAETIPQTDAVVLTPTDEGLNSVALDADGKIVGAGFSSVGLNASIAVLKLNTNGSLDQTFNATGQLGNVPGLAIINISQFTGVTNIATGITADLATGVAIDSQGRIVVVGSSDNGLNLNLFVIRLTREGQLDMTFNAQSTTPGIFTFSLINADLTSDDIVASAVVLNPDDSIVVGGSIIARATSAVDVSTNFIVLKVTPTGMLDTTFNAAGTTPGFVIQDFQGFDDEAFDIVIDQAQRILIGGFSQQFSAGTQSSTGGVQSFFALARYNANGTLDTTFNGAGLEPGAPGTVLTAVSQNTDSIRGLAITGDAKIVATGFSDGGINRSFATTRYNDNGTLDTTFNSEGTNGPRPGIVVTTILPMLNTEGDDGISTINQAQAVVLGTDDQIYITGFSFDGVQNNFTTINYLPTGAFNITFNPNGLVSSVPGIVITLFGEALNSLGFGVPIPVTEDLSGVSPSIIEGLSYPPEPIVPTIKIDISQVQGAMRTALSGRASPNSAIGIFIDGIEGPVATTYASKNGVWNVSLPGLKDGTYELIAVSRDPVSGIGLASQAVPLSIHTDVPHSPIIEAPRVDERVAIQSPIIIGRADPGSLVTVFVDDIELAQVKTGEEGGWSAQTSVLAEGTHSATALARNEAGIVSPLSSAVSFDIDTGAELAPRITFPSAGFIVSQPEVIVRGVGAPNSTVKLYAQNSFVADVPVRANGEWSYTMKNLTGAYNVHAMSSSKRFTSEKIPFTVSVPKQMITDTELANTGLIQGRAQPGSLIDFYVDKRHIGSTTVDSQGAWAYTPTDDRRLTGEHPVKVVISDAGGAPRSILERRVSF